MYMNKSVWSGMFFHHAFREQGKEEEEEEEVDLLGPFAASFLWIHGKRTWTIPKMVILTNYQRTHGIKKTRHWIEDIIEHGNRLFRYVWSTFRKPHQVK